MHRLFFFYTKMFALSLNYSITTASSLSICLSKANHKGLRFHVSYTPTFINNLAGHVTLEIRLSFFFCVVQLALCPPLTSV